MRVRLEHSDIFDAAAEYLSRRGLIVVRRAENGRGEIGVKDGNYFMDINIEVPKETDNPYRDLAVTK